MTTPSVVRRQIANSLKDKEYRDEFVSEHISSGIAFQIRAMRDDRGWSQEDLAERTGKKQATISRLENPDYGRYTLSTLKELASAFDVALVVRFAPFSELLDHSVGLSRETLTAPAFDQDEGLSPSAAIRAVNTESAFHVIVEATMPPRYEVSVSSVAASAPLLRTIESNWNRDQSGTADHNILLAMGS